MNKITKVVIPVAGMGTRFLPITKTISKTLLPLIDKPVIQYLLEEAVNAGITDALLIIGENQNDVIDYFNMDSDYIHNLKKEYDEINAIKELKSKINISFIVQREARGLGDAVYHAKDFANGDDFALILGDDFVFSNNQEIYGIGSLCNMYELNDAYYLGVQKVPVEATYRYGIVDPASDTSDNFKIKGVVEKPKTNPPSNYACVGRYILKNNIFDALEKIEIGVGGELQLADALDLVTKSSDVYATAFGGIRYDVGNKRDYVNAIVAIAKTRNDI